MLCFPHSLCLLEQKTLFKTLIKHALIFFEKQNIRFYLVLEKYSKKKKKYSEIFCFLSY